MLRAFSVYGARSTEYKVLFGLSPHQSIQGNTWWKTREQNPICLQRGLNPPRKHTIADWRKWGSVEAGDRILARLQKSLARRPKRKKKKKKKGKKGGMRVLVQAFCNYVRYSVSSLWVTRTKTASMQQYLCGALWLTKRTTD